MERNRRSYLAAAETKRRQMRYGRDIIPQRESTPVNYPSEASTAAKSQPATSAVEQPSNQVLVEESQTQPVFQPALVAEAATESPATIEFNLSMPKLRLSKLRLPNRRFIRNLPPRAVAGWRWLQATWRRFRATKVGATLDDIRVRLSFAGLAVLIAVSGIMPLIQSHLSAKAYAFGDAASLLTPTSSAMADKLKLDPQSQTYKFNSQYSPPTNTTGSAGADQAIASISQDLQKGINVSDPLHGVSLTMTPQFAAWQGKQDSNRVVFPLTDGSGWMVYSVHAVGVKEDILLSHATSGTKTFDYTLGLGSSLAARVESDGSLGVYGDTLLAGNITTSSDSDAALLQKAREHGAKNTLLFTIPAPTIQQKGGGKSAVTARYSLLGNTLRLTVSNLQAGNYPIDIDPSVYVTTAAQFMRGNNESNISFDSANDLILKGKTTGARINSWTAATAMNNSAWGQGTTVMGGYVYSVGGIAGGGTRSTYYTNGSSNFVIPTGVTALTIRAWGAGGGGGRGSGSTGSGGGGGGGGFARTTLTGLTSGTTLTVLVGSGGVAAAGASRAGDGGGYTAVKNGATFLIQAGGGGGGGGTRGTGNGGDGGGGGGANGVAGGAGDSGGGGGGGAIGATGGTAGTIGPTGHAGVAGAANAGGNGGGFGGTCTNGAGTAGGSGTTGGPGGGGSDASNCSNGGGGGGGRAGGGGGGSSGTNNDGGGAGGGGSDLVTGSNTEEIAGSGTSAGNGSDPLNNGAGAGGTGSTGSATAGADGGVVISYTTSGGAAISNTVSWAHFNTSTNAIESPNPGAGTCSGWCTSTAYNLPASLTDVSIVGYNGFLYVMGGADVSGVAQTSVYIAKIGANGEPQLWDPAGGTQHYWYTATALPAARTQFAAVASNNFMYILGGLTSGTPANTLLTSNTVQVASITPTGTLSAFSSTGMQALPSGTGTYGLSAQVYNNVLYEIGGNNSFTGTPTTTVEYSHLNTDGTMNSWQTTNNLSAGRMGGGGNFSTIWGGYLYVAGGCQTVNGSGFCTATNTDVELASINADGSLDTWNAIIGLDNMYLGQTVTAWQNGLYRVGGCGTESTSAKSCIDPMADASYGVVNQDGDASTVATSSPSGTAPCSGASPTNCDIPSTASIGQALNSTAVVNGFLYVIGGCTSAACSAMSTDVVYSAISPTGALAKPTTCTSGTFSGTWCIDTTDTVTGGIGAAAVAIFNSRIYLVGGLNGSANKTAIYYTTVAANGTISAWSNTTFATANITNAVAGYTSLSYEYAYARANPASAGTNPGNLYIFGGCTASSAAGCTAYTSTVLKCNIATAGSINACNTTSQLQIGIVPGDTAAGLGIMSGTVYANYIYLIGGVSPNQTDLTTVRYAKFDNNNNVVTTSSGWVESPVQMSVGRRRAAAFGYNGYIYVVGGYDGTGGGGVLADIEFAKVNVSNGSLVDQSGGSNKFNVSSVHIGARWGLSVPVSNSYAYVIGGCNTGASPTCGTMTSTVQTFQVYNNDSGTASTFAATGSCSSTAVSGPCANANGVDRIGASATILNGYIYLAGGATAAAGTGITNKVSYAPIDANGAVGAWATGGTLPGNRSWGKLLGIAGTLYYVGGQNAVGLNTSQSSIYYTTSITAGSPTWFNTGTTTTTLPISQGGTATPRTQFGATVWNNRIYIVGGYNASSAVTNTVEVSPPITGGDIATGTWAAGTALSVARAGVIVTAYANNLYAFGGNDGTNYLNDSQYSQINASTGASGSWTYTTSLPTTLSDGDAFAANGYMYILGGRSAATTCSPVALVSPISANTSISSGNNPTGIGEWYQTNSTYSTGRYGAAATYYDGRAYIMTGACNSTFPTNADRNSETTVLSQPQIAQYSLMIDADTDVFPSKWLLNGIDNSVGASWQLSYQSMKNTTSSCLGSAMTTWGQVTNVGNVTLGTPGTYTALDGSGTNTTCARFYYMYVSIDASQTFGYPEDITRGPTINDLTLQFTSDPSKRLMHGRTFIGGVQQPDDTPF